MRVLRFKLLATNSPVTIRADRIDAVTEYQRAKFVKRGEPPIMELFASITVGNEIYIVDCTYDEAVGKWLTAMHNQEQHDAQI